MKVIVQKFGGTSVRNEAGRLKALSHTKKAIEKGYKVVVVVSAMGRKGEPYATDSLLSLIGGKNTSISKREQDLLLSCGEIISSLVFSNMLLENGIRSTALTGAQAGFRTNDDFNNAKIVEMRCSRLLKELETHDAVVVAGFQGATKDGDVTTIGRGGSDTSASALGVALKAEYIDIFTDVEGIMTADPRISSKARPIQVASYNEVCNMAYQGAKVIHPRAVEIAMNSNVPIRIRSTYSDGEGTLVTTLENTKAHKEFRNHPVTGIAHVTSLTQIKVFAKEEQYNLQAEVFKAMAKEGISVDFINISPRGVVYTVPSTLADGAITVLEALGYKPVVESECAKISVVGAGMTGVPGVTSAIVSTLSNEGIRILQSADSHTTIWVLVKEQDLISAINALHDTFQLQERSATFRVG
ncbi:aspartate kinase (plasmid) [Cytobacillus spongiae]|uniref:aspartate kinase n=1 Tax=Cytobacillus spongiae TaxID=2901381 RepID=UPI00145C7739|nr:aspartate kinase [Cytobacillus spongiae]MCA1062426.1 aspartate kinase [Rossellomorea aquimaris]NMH71131.1 aspartate kinase [Bacillus sp. RO3]UII58026.1 aspartate kinase [Cytobacillus spongiae]WJV28870.1 aspartate kinase [Rossellomorea sp. AcN35-11]